MTQEQTVVEPLEPNKVEGLTEELLALQNRRDQVADLFATDPLAEVVLKPLDRAIKLQQRAIAYQRKSQNSKKVTDLLEAMWAGISKAVNSGRAKKFAELRGQPVSNVRGLLTFHCDASGKVHWDKRSITALPKPAPKAKKNGKQTHTAKGS